MIALLRHGATADNTDKRVRRSDTPLSQEGRQAAQDAAEAMRGLPIKEIYASPLERAQETAQIWSKVAGVPVKTLPDLRARDMGMLEGKKVEAVEGILDTLSKHPRVRPPGGGESVEQFVNQRYLPAVHPLIHSQELVGVVGHGSGIKAIELGMGGKPLSDWNKEPVIQPGAWAIVTPHGIQNHDGTRMDSKDARPESGISS